MREAPPPVEVAAADAAEAPAAAADSSEAAVLPELQPYRCAGGGFSSKGAQQLGTGLSFSCMRPHTQLSAAVVRCASKDWHRYFRLQAGRFCHTICSTCRGFLCCRYVSEAEVAEGANVVELLLGPLDPVTPNLQTVIDTVLGKDGQQGKVCAARETTGQRSMLRCHELWGE